MSLRKPLKSLGSTVKRKLRTGAAIAMALIIAACGGGASDTVASWPGTGGTGITAVTATGPVVGFGSVVVNGIRFEDTTANVLIDGQEQLKGDTSLMRLGMVAYVAGQKSSATVTTTSVIKARGTAERIEVWSIAQGTISAVLSSTTFKVAGMDIVVDAGTVLSGAMSTNDLNTQTVVKVWGQPMNADFSQWAANRIEVLGKAYSTISTGQIVLRGTVPNTIPSLNGIALAGTETVLTNGQLVRAVGSLASYGNASTLTVGKVTVLGSNGTTTPATGYAEIEGIVTSLVLSTNTANLTKVIRITLGATEVDISGVTVSPVDAIIAIGKRLEVQGNWGASVLVATKVAVKSEIASQEVEIEAEIEQFTSVANFVVRGQRCDASGLSLTPLQISKLGVNVLVHLEGRKNGDVVRVSELEIKSR
jgi:Domain of unknown function (DUF5666)